MEIAVLLPKFVDNFDKEPRVGHQSFGSEGVKPRSAFPAATDRRKVL
jgi:hypothetical protein